MAKKVKIEIDFDVEDTVFLKTDVDQFPRLVTGVLLRGGHAKYLIRYADEEESEHFHYELSDTIDPLIKEKGEE